MPIRQPPHSNGVPFQGLRARIDPNQIPSTADAFNADTALWSQVEEDEEDAIFLTCGDNRVVPLSSTDYTAVDQGNSTPRFIRPTTYNIPSSSNLANICKIPLAVIVQPFAEVPPAELQIPLAAFSDSETGPPRCSNENCRAYINAWCSWTMDGSRWKCNLCGMETTTSSEYFAPLGPDMRRIDHLDRVELNFGTVDFTVPSAYWAAPPPARLSPSFIEIDPPPDLSELRPPQPLAHVFAIDASVTAIASGFTRAACNSLKWNLLSESAVPPPGPIAIMTFDSSLHFYEFVEDDPEPRMRVVADLEEVFTPTYGSILVNVKRNRESLDKLLTFIPDCFANTTDPFAALGSSIRASLAILARRGGHIVAFQSVLPELGTGALAPRPDETQFYGEKNETVLFRPRDPSWGTLGEECAETGVAVTMFFGTQRPVDIPSVGATVSISGGEIFFHPRFDDARDIDVLMGELYRVLNRDVGYNCSFTLRCSAGLRISSMLSATYQHSPSTLEFGCLDADKAICVSLQHSKSIPDAQNAFVQSALLYTTREGARRVRVCNLSLRASELAGNVFRYADMDATVCFLLREALKASLSQSLKDVHEDLTDRCADILLAYRHNCAVRTPLSQLILPEAFKLLPMLTLSIIKCRPLKSGHVSSDVRAFHRHRLGSLGVRATMTQLYPRLFSLLPGLEHVRSGYLPVLRGSYTSMEPDVLYLIDNGHVCMLWVGSQLSQRNCAELFGVESVYDIPTMCPLSNLDTSMSSQLNAFLGTRYRFNGRPTQLIVTRENMDGSEVEFGDMLVEDQNNGSMSYVDFLCLVHRRLSSSVSSSSDSDSLGKVQNFSQNAGDGILNSGLRNSPW